MRAGGAFAVVGLRAPLLLLPRGSRPAGSATSVPPQCHLNAAPRPPPCFQPVGDGRVVAVACVCGGGRGAPAVVLDDELAGVVVLVVPEHQGRRVWPGSQHGQREVPDRPPAAPACTRTGTRLLIHGPRPLARIRWSGLESEAVVGVGERSSGRDWRAKQGPLLRPLLRLRPVRFLNCFRTQPSGCPAVTKARPFTVLEGSSTPCSPNAAAYKHAHTVWSSGQQVPSCQRLQTMAGGAHHVSEDPMRGAIHILQLRLRERRQSIGA